MPLPVVADRVAETSQSVGTGNFVLQGAIVGYRRFYNTVGMDAEIYYLIESQVGEWEAGIGTLITASTLRRDTVLCSSNADVFVDFSEGNKTVFIDVPAKRIAASGSFLYTQIAPAEVWTIDHNMGKYPTAEVIDTDGRRMYADIVHISTNRLKIFCSPASAGQTCLS